MKLTVRVLSVFLLAGALLAPRLQWRRSAFTGFIVLGLFSFALRAGWPARPLVPTACELLVGPALALHSFRNTPHILLFVFCYFLARAQFRWAVADAHARRRGGVEAFALTLVIGALVELAQGASGAGHCRLRDLLPDATGALLGWAILVALMTAYTRWGRSRTDA